MNSPRPHNSRTSVILIAIFALASLGIGIVAWSQYKELIGLRASRISEADLEAQKKRAFAAEQRIKQLEAEIAALKAAPAPQVQVARGGPEAARGGRGNDPQAGRGGGPGGRGGAQFAAVTQTPQYQRALLAQERANVELQYGALFRNLNLPAEQIEQVKTLLVDRQNVVNDIVAAAQAQGVQGANLQELIAQAQAEINTNIQNALGAEGYAQMQQYQATFNQRQQVSQLQAIATMAGAPLDANQTEQLIQVLTQTSTRGGRGGGGGFGGGGGLGLGGGRGGAQVNISANDIAAIQGILSPAQMQVVTQVQQQQAASNQVNQLLNTARGGGGGGDGGAAAPAAAAGGRGGRAQPAAGGGGRGGRGGG